MTTRSAIHRLLQLLPTLAALLLPIATAHAQNAWTGGAGTGLWSSPGNWSWGIVPSAEYSILFDNNPPAAAAGVVDNTLDASFTVDGLAYGTLSSVGYHTTLIGPGRSLQIGDYYGDGGDAIYVGTGATLTGAVRPLYAVVGAGTLSLSTPLGPITVVQGGDNNDHYAALNLTGLTNFSANVSQILVGCITNTTAQGLRPMGLMYLAETNFIQTAAGATRPGIMVGAYPTADTNLRGTQQLFLGRHNVIHSDAISAGGHKTAGQILFRSGLTGGLATIRGSAGGADRVKILTIGDLMAGTAAYDRGGTSTSMTGTFNATGNYLDLLVADLYVGRGQPTGTGTGTGVFTFDQGVVDADNVFVGYHPTGTSAAGNGVGTLSVNGTAKLTVNNDLTLARKVGSANPTGTLNVATGATVNVKGSVVTAGGASTLNLNGILDLQPAGDPTPGSVAVSTLTGAGTIADTAATTVSAALTPGAALTAGTMTVGGDLALQAGALFNVNLADAPTVGSGINDLVSVAGTLTLNNNGVVLTPIGSALANGTYRLFEHTGARTGVLNLTNTTRYTLALEYPANQVNLTVSGSAGSVKWNSLSSTAWDFTTTNWLNLASATPDRFLTLDNALVDDSDAYQTNLLLATSIAAGTVTVNSSARDYVLGGAGRLTGGSTLLKQGAAMLTVSNANDFNGSVQVQGGVLRTANAAALGNATGQTTVAAGATLDIYGSSLYNPGERVTITGHGATNGGAVINTGAAQNNGLRYLTLAGDASIGTWPNRFDVRGPGGAGSFNGALDLNGFTLTKKGPAQHSIVDSTATNAGAIVLDGGILGLTRSLVDGPGAIYSRTNVIYLENNTTGYVAKPLVFEGGTLRVTGADFSLASPITNVSGLTVDNASALTLTNVLSGAGPLNKIAAGRLILQAQNSFTGPTTISIGQLVLGPNATISGTPSLTLNPGTTLDVSALPGGFSLASGQTLAGSGVVLGDVTAGAGATVVPGTSIGTLTFSNALSLTNGTLPFELAGDTTPGAGINDLVSVAGNLSLGGVNEVKVIPVAPLNNAAPYTLLRYGGTLSGTAANLDVTSDSRYHFTVVDPAFTPGEVQVNVTGSGIAADLLWRGGAAGNPNAWDTKLTANWLNGITPDVFFLGDSVRFDDTATTGQVTLVGTLQPAAITVNNAARAYAFGGAGRLLAGSLQKLGSGSLTLGNDVGNTFSTLVTVDAGTLALANAGANTFGGGLLIRGGTVSIANAAANAFGAPIALDAGTLLLNHPFNATLSGVLSNSSPGVAGVLQKLGVSTLTLGAASPAFDGEILVSAGTLRASSAAALGTTTGGTTIASGATFDIAGVALNNPGDLFTIAGTGLNNTGAVINSGAEVQSGLRAVALSANASVAQWGNRWDIRGPGGSGSFNGLLDLNGFTLTKLGPGKMAIVDATVSNPGVIDIAAGTLGLTRSQISGDGPIQVNHNVLQFENNSISSISKPITVNGGAFLVTGNAFALDSGVNNLAGGLTVETTVNLTMQGELTGPGPLTKISTNTLILAGYNSCTGPMVVNAGALRFNHGFAQGNSTRVTAINTTGVTGGTGPVVELAASAQMPPTLAYTMHTTNSPDIRSSLRGLGVGSEWQGPVIPTGDGRAGLYTDSASSELIISGPLTNAGFSGVLFIRGGAGAGRLTGPVNLGTGQLFKTDAGAWSIGGIGHTWSRTTVAVGTLKLQGSQALCVAAPLTMGQNDANTAVLDLNGFNQSVPALNNVGTGPRRIGNDSYQSDSIFTYAGGTNVSSYSGEFLDNLTANGFYRLALSVASGALFLNGSNSYTGPTIVQSGATLGGSGRLASPVTVQTGGRLAPGASIGTLTIHNTLDFSAGSTNLAELNGATLACDQVAGLTSVTYAGTLAITNLSATPPAPGASFKLFAAAAYNGAFTAIVPASPGPGLLWDTSSLTVDGTLKVIAAPDLTGIARRSDGNMRLTVEGAIGQPYSVWASTNVALPLSTWSLLTSGTIPAVPFFYDDLTATNYPRRFYNLSTP